jgi:translation initiation factor IF-2
MVSKLKANKYVSSLTANQNSNFFQSTYIEYKEIKGAIGVKIAAKDLEKAIAGLNIQVALSPDEVEICREEVARELKSALSSIRLQERGVYVQASTLGSLEALLEFLKTSSIPVRKLDSFLLWTEQRVSAKSKIVGSWILSKK